MFILILKTRYWTDDRESVKLNSLIDVNVKVFYDSKLYSQICQ